MIYTELLQNTRHGIVNEAVPEKLLDLYKEMTKTTQWIVCIYFLKMPRLMNSKKKKKKHNGKSSR